MTLPEDVAAILDSWDVLAVDHQPQGWPAVRMRELTAIRAHLLSQDAEIERLQSGLAKHVNRVCDLQSSLAAADALLRDIKNWDVDAAQGTCLMVPHSLRSRIQAHLQGAGNEH